MIREFLTAGKPKAPPAPPKPEPVKIQLPTPASTNSWKTSLVPYDLPLPIAKEATMATHSGWALPNGIVYSTHDGRVTVSNLQNVGRNAIVKSSAVQRGLELIGPTCAELFTETLHIIDDDGKKVKPNREQQRVLDLIMKNPNEEESAFELFSNGVIDYILSGNCLFAIRKVGSRPVSLHRMLPDAATTGYDEAGNRYYDGPLSDNYIAGTDRRAFDRFISRRVVHVRFRNLSGTRRTDSRAGFVTGLVENLSDTLSINPELDKYCLEFFTSDISSLRVQITADRPVGKDDAETFRQYVKKLAELDENFVFLPEGLTLNPVKNESIDQSMAALRKFQINETCRALGLPTYMLNEERSGVNIEIAAREFWMSCIKTHVNAFKSAMNKRLLRPGYSFAIDESELVKGNVAAITALMNATRGDAQRAEDTTSGERRMMMGLDPEMPEDPNRERIEQDLRFRQGIANSDGEGSDDSQNSQPAPQDKGEDNGSG